MKTKFAIILLLLLGLCALRLALGPSSVAYPSSSIIWRLRINPILTATAVGIALAIAGVLMQALLRNPLAEPYILGIASGAGVGLMTQQFIAINLQTSLGANYIGATLGALASIAILLLASRKQGGINTLSLLLIGVVLSTLNAAIIMVIQYLIPRGLKANLIDWMMGYLNQDNDLTTLILTNLAFIAFTAYLTYTTAKAIDLITFSKTQAASMGVNVGRVRLVLFLFAGLLTAAAVALAGPIGFVGFICPHIARKIFTSSHRVLLPASAILGATLLVLADTLSVYTKILAGQYHHPIGQMPIGIFTALIGGPVFIYIIKKQF